MRARNANKQFRAMEGGIHNGFRAIDQEIKEVHTSSLNSHFCRVLAVRPFAAVVPLPLEAAQTSFLELASHVTRDTLQHTLRRLLYR